MALDNLLINNKSALYFTLEPSLSKNTILSGNDKITACIEIKILINKILDNSNLSDKYKNTLIEYSNIQDIFIKTN